MYATLGAVLKLSPELVRGRRWLRGTFVACSFVLADVFALVIQGAGMGIYATAITSGTDAGPTIKMGCIITVLGLALQVTLSGGCFVLCYTALRCAVLFCSRPCCWACHAAGPCDAAPRLGWAVV